VGRAGVEPTTNGLKVRIPINFSQQKIWQQRLNN
jgi:hypothetical protein